MLRRTRPELPRGFRVPGVPVVPIIGRRQSRLQQGETVITDDT